MKKIALLVLVATILNYCSESEKKDSKNNPSFKNTEFVDTLNQCPKKKVVPGLLFFVSLGNLLKKSRLAAPALVITGSYALLPKVDEHHPFHGLFQRCWHFGQRCLNLFSLHIEKANQTMQQYEEDLKKDVANLQKQQSASAPVTPAKTSEQKHE